MVNTPRKKGGGQITAHLTLTSISVAVGFGIPAGNFFPGAMDEVAIFHSALEQEDIQELMEKGFKNYLAVDPREKLGLTWGHIKTTHPYK